MLGFSSDHVFSVWGGDQDTVTPWGTFLQLSLPATFPLKFQPSEVMHAQSLQLCPTLCNPADYSPPGSS